MGVLEDYWIAVKGDKGEQYCLLESKYMKVFSLI